MRAIRLAFLLLLCCSFLPTARTFAQVSELDNVTYRLAAALERAHTNAAIVADFTGEEGGVTLQGVLLADRIWISLLQEQRSFQTLPRQALRKPLDREHLSSSNFVATKEIEAAQAAGADVLITGGIERRDKELIVSVRASKVPKLEQIDQQMWRVPRTGSLDALAEQPIQVKTPFYLLGQNGVTMPSCAYCPNPQYSDSARKHKVEGTVVLMVLIESSGRVSNVWEIRGLPEGLTEHAIEVVRQQWRFQPARDANGTAVTMIAPIDVSFRLM